MTKYFISLTFVIFLISAIACCNKTKNEIDHPLQSDNSKVDSTITNSIIKDTADYNSIIEKYKSSLDNNFFYKGCSYFVVISNLDSIETERIINKTILSAVDCFYNDYFERRPDELTTIFLFKNDETYRYWAKKLFDDYEDLSRFGYYKPGLKVMLMNISTGTGTLVHELTHALVRYDFPDIPSWFNEGLGSLYEHCSLSDRTILGYVNWRLPALQDAINDTSYTSLSDLINTNDDEFYGNNSGINYAQARYFCMFMQEKNYLRKFYKAFRDNFEKDKTGKAQIEKIFGQSLNEIDKEFVKWVMTLNYYR